MAVIDDLLKPQNSYDIQDNMVAKMKEQDAKPAATTTELPERMNYVDMYKQLYKEPQKDPELEEKRMKRNMLLGSIGDAFSAFHTAYAKSRGMQPMVNPGESLTGKMRERYDRLNKEHEARKKEYDTGLMQAQRMQNQEDFNLQKLREEVEARKAAQAFRNKQEQDVQRRHNETMAQRAAELAEKNRHNKAMENKPTGRRSSTKNQGWTTTVRDRNGKVIKETQKTYGSSSEQDNQQRDQNGKIIIKY